MCVCMHIYIYTCICVCFNCFRTLLMKPTTNNKLEYPSQTLIFEPYMILGPVSAPRTSGGHGIDSAELSSMKNI